MKSERQSKIIELIKNRDIETQYELMEMLKNEGFKTTQATVSRDIKELNIIKNTNEKSGKQKYCLILDNEKIPERLLRVFEDSIISVDYAKNIIVIKTFSGMAMVAATAIDAMNDSEILGTIAGDDTVFTVVKSEESALKVTLGFKNIIKGESR